MRILQAAMDMLGVDAQGVREPWRFGFEPREELSVWEHAAKYMNLSRRVSAFPGLYDPQFNPILNVPMHFLGVNSRVEKTVVIKGTQCGGTLIAMLYTAYIANCSPGPTMIVVSDEDERDEYSIKLDEFLNCCVPLRPKLAKLASRNKLDLKYIPGSQIYLSSATVARSLRGKSVQYLICSEISNWVKNCQGQGDPFSIALNRPDAFDGRKKIYVESTPTAKGSNIEKEFKKCKVHLTMYWACPHCGHYQSPDFFHDMRWPKNEVTGNDDPKKAYLVCQNPNCEVKRIDEAAKPKMLRDFKLGPVPWLKKET